MALYDMMKNNPSSDFYNAALDTITRKKRAILSALIELSPICNFHCPFCYARKTPEEIEAEGGRVLRADYWKRIIDQLAEMHVLHLGFTGGECMLHPDFAELYQYAIKKGMQVSMISNLSCMTKDILDIFIKYPPKNISITIYGASKETYAKVCGKGTFYEKVMYNLDCLKEAQIRFQIQMTVCRDNQDDLQEVDQISKRLGVPFTFNEAIIPFQQCSEEMRQNVGVNTEKLQTVVKKLQEQDENRYSSLEKFPGASPIMMGVGCSAGRNAAFINYRGYMQPCVSFSEIKVSTFENSLSECWKQIVDACDCIPRIPECNGCIHWNRCKHCFAMHYYDTHDFKKPSPRLCFKYLYPEKAARIEEYYSIHGVFPVDDE